MTAELQSDFSRTKTANDLATAEVVVIVVCYNGREFLPDCLSSIYASDDGGLRVHVVVVDNASQDGSEAFVRERFPQVTLLPAGANLGFAAANNLAWHLVREQAEACEFVYLLNQDTIVESGWLRPLVDYFRAHADVGSLQSKLLLHPATHLINTVGNNSHFLGFGFPAGYGAEDDGRFATPRTINYASGAGVIVRTALLRELGLFEDAMFMYLEDADLSWKIRQAGYDVRMLPASRVYHKYRFNRGYRFYYELERNRWWLLLVYYRVPTLLLLAPALLLMEFGQLAFAARRGRFLDKLRAYGFFCSPANLGLIARLRRAAGRRRKISDREFTRDFAAVIRSPELNLALVRYVANPLFGTYWAIARRLMFW